MLVSVIMPVYKVEDYVEGAIRSILNQTLTDFELLAVDDGSPDKSGDICEKLAGEDSRIKVFHQKNAGAPAARNFAMERASGKYYYFMDADDYAEPDMLSDMVEIAERDMAQLVVAGFYIDTYYNDTQFRRDTQSVPSVTYKTAQSFREDAYKLFDKNLLYTPWNKLWLREYVDGKGLRFPGTFWDDFPFVLSVIRDAERVSVTEKPYYHFIRKRAESETAAYRPQMYDKREEENGWMKELYSYWGISDEASEEFVARRYIERLIGCIENLTNPGCTLQKSEIKAKIKAYITAPSARQALKKAKPHSLMMKAMLIPVRMKNTSLTYLESKIITYVKTHNTKVFSALKAGR